MNVSEFKMGVELNGYISDMPEDYYHTTKGFISKSSLSVLKTSPFKFFSNVKVSQTPAMKIGTAIHCAVLEPVKFNDTYLLMPEIKTKTLKAYKDAVKDNPEMEVINGQDALNVIGMQKAIANNEAAMELLSLHGNYEVSGFHEDNDTGVKLRHRFDKLTNCGIGIDLKKTQSVSLEEISKTIFKYGYHMQDALYSDAYKAITGHELNQFYFIFVEEKYPHEVAVVYLDDISKQIGRDEYKTLLHDFVYYKNNPEKVTNNSGVEMVSLPEWAMRSYENELENGGVF